MVHKMLFSAAVFLLFVSSLGCGTMPNKRGWGEDVSLTPGWKRAGRAALSAAKDPLTWAPAAGALAFRIGNADSSVTEWGAGRTPLFGSSRNAEEMSDNFLTAAGIAWAVSALAAPSGDTFRDWTVNKSKGMGFQTAGATFMRSTVGYIKNATDRKEPDGIHEDSLPSGHITLAAYFATLTSRNIRTLGWSQNALTASDAGLGTLTVATAWARIEHNQHFPSDALASIALGHFFGAFLTDAFLGLDNPGNITVLFAPSRGSSTAMVRFNF